MNLAWDIYKMQAFGRGMEDGAKGKVEASRSLGLSVYWQGVAQTVGKCLCPKEWHEPLKGSSGIYCLNCSKYK